MGGLLYKDFVSVKGKKLCLVIITLTVVYMILRIIFPGNLASEGFMILTEQGDMVSLLDSFFAYVPAFFLIFACYMINNFVAKIVEDDKKNKIMNYICSMPISKKMYIASKYIFIAIAVYVFVSEFCILSVTGKAFCMEGIFLDALIITDTFAPMFFSLALFFATIELPLFIYLGREKAMMIKIGIGIAIALCFIWYLLFGNLQVLAELDLEAIMDFVERYKSEFTILQAISPVMTLLLYYLSYRITCFAGAKEGV